MNENKQKKIHFQFIIRSAGIKPVVALPYNSNNWKIRNVIRILAKFSEMNLNNIVWQLGSGTYIHNKIKHSFQT